MTAEEQIQKLSAERDAALKACAEMRELLDEADAPRGENPYRKDSWSARYERALSTDCGKGYHADSEWEQVVEALDRIYRNALIADGINVLRVDTIWLRQECAKALAHAEKLREGK